MPGWCRRGCGSGPQGWASEERAGMCWVHLRPCVFLGAQQPPRWHLALPLLRCPRCIPASSGASALSPVFTQAAAGGTNHLPPLMDTRLPLTAARCFWERLLTSGCNLPPKVPSPSLAAPHKGRWQNTHCRDPRKGSRGGMQPPPPLHRPLWQGPYWPRGEAVRLGPWCGCPAGGTSGTPFPASPQGISAGSGSKPLSFGL